MYTCWGCDPKAQEMIEWYAFSNDSYMGEEVFPHTKHDLPFVFVEPHTGVTVANTLKFQVAYQLTKDYYYNNLYEVVEGKGLYMPYYEQYRSTNLTYHHTVETFSALIFMEDIIFYGHNVGYIGAGFAIALSVLLALYWYRHYEVYIRKKRRNMDYTYVSEMDDAESPRVKK
jgi:hypothetical protein